MAFSFNAFVMDLYVRLRGRMEEQENDLENLDEIELIETEGGDMTPSFIVWIFGVPFA
ncbi:MAG: hypothetical protein HY646_22720 [Acidobacteria bacterium]|nr:hypothetical protein [Acidobacteriota bacterium]